MLRSCCSNLFTLSYGTVRYVGAIGRTETLCREGSRELRETRVTLFTREGYYEGTPAPQALDVDVAASREDEPFIAAFELQTEVPTVLNEVRIHAVEWACDCEAACSDGDRDSGKRRLVPPFIVTCSTDGSTFAPPIVTHGGTATGMEARALVLRNAPRRRLARDEPRRTAGPASRGALGAGRPPGLRRPVVIDRARPA